MQEDKNSEKKDLTPIEKKLYEILKHEKSLYAFNKELAKFFIINDYIPYFIKLYLKETPPKSFLNIWAGLKEAEKILKPLVSFFKPKEVVALDSLFRIYDVREINEDGKIKDNFIEIEIEGKKQSIYIDEDTSEIFSSSEEAHKYYEEKMNELEEISGIQIDWNFGDTWQLLEELDAKFDLIVGYVPFIRIVSKRKPKDKYKGELDYIILSSLKLLTSRGSGIFIVRSDFFRNFPNIYDDLEKAGMYIEAVLTLPYGISLTLLFGSDILLLIRKGKESKTFVGDLTSKEEILQNLVNNLRSRIEGKIPQLGIFVKSRSIIDLHELLYQKSINTIISKLHYNRYRLSDITAKIYESEEDFSKDFNSIFVHIGDFPVEDSFSELERDAKYYIQIVLDQEKAIAKFVAKFLNTNLGRKILRPWYSSGMKKPELLSCKIYLPPIAKQREFVNLYYKINNILMRLENLEFELWDQPKKFKKIENIIERMNYDNEFKNWIEIWIEAMPFPLASILWLYVSDTIIEHKIDHLFHFFEALSEFNSMLILSAFNMDDSFYHKECSKWIEKSTEFRNWFYKPTFGNWNYLGRKLSSTLRSYLNDDEKKNYYINLFRLSEEFLKMISDKKMYNILEKVLKWRNFKSHSGIIDKEELDRIILNLENSLSKIQNIIGIHYKNVSLIKPGPNIFKAGIFYHEIKKLTGVITPFKILDNFESLEPMDVEKLYFIDTQIKKPLEIKFPFIKILDSPKEAENICYFFNGIEKEKFQFTSYHHRFESNKELIDSELEKAISLLRFET